MTTPLYDFTVPAATAEKKEFDLARSDLVAAIGAGSTFALAGKTMNVYGAGPSNFYGDFIGFWNHGAGLCCPDYQRVTAVPGECTGANIVHKTALRGTPNVYGQWLYSDNAGPNCQAIRSITADNPTAYGDKSYPIPNIDVINDNLDVTNAVFQWNVSPGSTGDFCRIFNKDGSLSFSIGRDGTITINGLTLDQIIAGKIAVAFAQARGI